MFLLYWEVYVLMELAVNSQNEHLRRTFIDGGAYMHFSGGVGSSVSSSVFMWFCIFLWTPNVSSCITGA